MRAGPGYIPGRARKAVPEGDAVAEGTGLLDEGSHPLEAPVVEDMADGRREMKVVGRRRSCRRGRRGKRGDGKEGEGPVDCTGHWEGGGIPEGDEEDQC